MQNIIGFGVLFIILLFLFSMCSPSRDEMTYRLIHAIGNSEREVARGLSYSECESRKRELKAVASALDQGGSITCLAENLFDD